MNSLISVKDPIDPSDRRGVYLIPCSYDKPYIGKIGPSFNMRLDEHIVDIKNNCFRSHALAEHAYKTKHHRILYMAMTTYVISCIMPIHGHCTLMYPGLLYAELYYGTMLIGWLVFHLGSFITPLLGWTYNVFRPSYNPSDLIH